MNVKNIFVYSNSTPPTPSSFSWLHHHQQVQFYAPHDHNSDSSTCSNMSFLTLLLSPTTLFFDSFVTLADYFFSLFRSSFFLASFFFSFVFILSYFLFLLSSFFSFLLHRIHSTCNIGF